VELIGDEGRGRIEVDWHELVRGHARDRSGLARPGAPELLSAARETDARWVVG
jgi:hypothetical protein